MATFQVGDLVRRKAEHAVGSSPQVRARLVKIAALAIAGIESIGRRSKPSGTQTGGGQ